MEIKGRLGVHTDDYFMFYCPGCETSHAINPKKWHWNGSHDKPSFIPSILVYSHKTFNKDGNIVDTPRCHSFITDGMIAYCSDTTHSLSGQTVELPEYKER